LETREAIIAASACARMIRMRPPKPDVAQKADMARKADTARKADMARKTDMAWKVDMAQKATWNGRVDFVGPGHLDIG
jgi:hypothetical protein